MKIVLAFDSFKNCMDAPNICQRLRDAFLEVRPDWDIVMLPLGDGGEGFTRTVVTAGQGTFHRFASHDPLNRPVQAEWGLLPDGSAVIEMAAASGIELLKPSEYNPLRASTYGTGELLKHLICERRIPAVCIGIGGSATVDGGLGMLQALGVRFLDNSGNLLPSPAAGGELAKIAEIDTSELLPELQHVSITVACDVESPLCGPTGAACVFGPQKGATPEMVKALDAGLLHFSEKAIQTEIADDNTHPGDGAAGGLGFALRNFLKARTLSGAECVLSMLHFDELLRNADWVLTGEGCSDEQTLQGKLPAVVARHARNRHVPCILLSGALKGDASKLETQFDAVLSLTAQPKSLEQAIADTPDNLRRMAHAVAALLGRSS